MEFKEQETPSLVRRKSLDQDPVALRSPYNDMRRTLFFMIFQRVVVKQPRQVDRLFFPLPLPLQAAGPPVKFKMTGISADPHPHPGEGKRDTARRPSRPPFDERYFNPIPILCSKILLRRWTAVHGTQYENLSLRYQLDLPISIPFPRRVDESTALYSVYPT